MSSCLVLSLSAVEFLIITSLSMEEVCLDSYYLT